MTNKKLGSTRKGGCGKLSRSETVTVRLDPKLRYLAELAARKHRRTLSSYVEWAVEESLLRVYLRDQTIDGKGNNQGAVSIGEMADSLWDIDDADRLAKLAMQFPELLTHEEQVLWKLIRESDVLWEGHYNLEKEWRRYVGPETLIYSRLREHWESFVAVAKGESDKAILPTLEEWKPDLPQHTLRIR